MPKGYLIVCLDSLSSSGVNSEILLGRYEDCYVKVKYTNEFEKAILLQRGMLFNQPANECADLITSDDIKDTYACLEKYNRDKIKTKTSKCYIFAL